MYDLSPKGLAGLKPGKHADGGGLYLYKRKGSASKPETASWVLRYQWAGKRTEMGMGPFPSLSLKDARARAETLRQEIKAGRNPKAERHAEKAELLAEMADTSSGERTLNTLSVQAWAAKRAGDVESRNSKLWFSPVRVNVLPKLGHRDVVDLSVEDVVDCFKPIWRKKPVVAEKAMHRLKWILRWCRSKDRGVDPTIVDDARMMLGGQNHTTKHHPALEWEKMPAFYKGLSDNVYDLAFRFLILTAVRVQSVTPARWDEIEDDVWRVPVKNLKRKDTGDFEVPLSSEAQKVLKAARELNPKSKLIFPSHRSSKGEMSKETFTKNLADWQVMNEAGETVVAHAMRATFRTWAEENQVGTRELREHVLHHKYLSDVESAYMRSQLTELRRPVMEAWGNFLLEKTAVEAIPIRA